MAGGLVIEDGQALSDVAAAILRCAGLEGLETVNLHDLSGFAQEKLIKFKRVKGKDLPYPDYIGVQYVPGKDEYPYPPEAMALTYDGLHPSDEGNRILADLFAAKIIETMKA